MADSHFSAHLQSPYLMATPPGPIPPGPEASVPPPPMPSGLANYSPYSYESSQFFQQGPSVAQMPHSDASPVPPFYYHQNRLPQHRQFSSPSGYRAPSFHAPAETQADDSHLASLPAGTFRSPHVPGSPHPDFPEARNELDMFPTMEYPLRGNGPFYPLQGYGPIPIPLSHGLSPYSGRRPSSVMQTHTPQPNRFNHEALQPGNPGRPSLRGGGSNTGSSDQPRSIASPPRRPPYERPHPQSPQTPGGRERRPQLYTNAYNHRSDRSVSPRTSNRRSFDRYSTDLPPSSTTDAEEAAARARRIRRGRPREPSFPARHFASQIDGMQTLKDKLRHFLPSELPEGSSTCCDICQKDYSTKHCEPTEEDEVAIQLPCKHVFGEHCINTWFETCQKHKNKITCPMCRALLVEQPIRSAPAFFSTMPEMLSFFSGHPLGRSRPDMSAAEQQAFAQLIRTRNAESDF